MDEALTQSLGEVPLSRNREPFVVLDLLADPLQAIAEVGPLPGALKRVNDVLQRAIKRLCKNKHRLSTDTQNRDASTGTAVGFHVKDQTEKHTLSSYSGIRISDHLPLSFLLLSIGWLE